MEDHGLGVVLSDGLGVLENGGSGIKSLKLKAHRLTGTVYGKESTRNPLGELSGLVHVLGLDFTEMLLNLEG